MKCDTQSETLLGLAIPCEGVLLLGWLLLQISVAVVLLLRVLLVVTVALLLLRVLLIVAVTVSIALLALLIALLLAVRARPTRIVLMPRDIWVVRVVVVLDALFLKVVWERLRVG